MNPGLLNNILFCVLAVLCNVDMTKHKGVSLLIEKVGSDPYCEMSVESVEKRTIEVEAGTKASLSFLDCPNEDVRLTASKVLSKMLSCCFSQQTVMMNFCGLKSGLKR